MKVIPFVLDST